MSARRILVLAPHPDDEVVGCCAAIARARAAGDAVFALYLTTGVPAADVEWPWRRARHAARVQRRRREALAVARRLGLEVAEMSDWPSRTLKRRLREAREWIRRAVARHAIDTVWTPAYEGGHADHDATNVVASTLDSGVRVVEFAEYSYRGGAVRRQELDPPSRDDVVLALTAAERARKRRLLAEYASERANLTYVGVTHERLRPLPAHDYARPPHPPPLFYQRFHWLPFRHPRVDFTRPWEISVAAARLRAAIAGER